MPLPAALLLQPDCTVKPGWAVFDPVWYLKKYGNFIPARIARTPADLLSYYLQHGARSGHAPSPFFDEHYYRSANPNIAALVKAGRYASGFDHFCQLGHRFHAGHWLFDDPLYGSLYDDMALENLDAQQFYGRYDHFLRSGQYEHRQPHLLFDSHFYRSQAIAAGDSASVIDHCGSFSHYLYRLATGATELPPSIYFDPAWYLRQNENADENADQKFGSAIAHYLAGRNPVHPDPVPEFSERYYCQTNLDLAGDYSNGYRHFLQTGVFEFRRPSPDIDLTFYRDANAEVRNALNTGQARDAFAHLRAVGLSKGLPCAPEDQKPATVEAAARQLFIRKARDNLAIFARRKIDFGFVGACQLSVIMVACEKFELTMLALSSLRSNFAGAMQLILVDNGSCDATADIVQYVAGASIIRLDRNIGYLRACNLALRQVAAEVVLFVNNDVEFGFGAVDAAIARIHSDPGIGAVGAKVIRMHGLLQEAGCIVWRDGSTSGYMRDASPLAPEANFTRDVDFCSGVFLLCRGAVVKRLGGFDPDFGPAYYEDADLCVRMAEAGFRVVVDPAIVIHHLEYGSAGSHAARALMQRGQRIFARKHAAFLATRLPNSPHNLVAARSPRGGRRNVLFIEDTVPLRRLGSGYARANDIVHAIVAAGHAASIFPVSGADFDVTSMFADLPDNVEILHDRDVNQLAEFLEARPGYYDLIWVSRTHNLSRILPACLQAGIDPGIVPFVLDTEAIVSLRENARAALIGVQKFDFASALRSELEWAPLCRHCIAVNDSEASLLRDAGLRNVSVLGTQRPPEPIPEPFDARSGLLFVASIHQPDSPNLDALHWYLQAILPALMREMEAPPTLNVAGHVAPGIDLSPFADHPYIKLHGAALSLRRHYAQNRLFIAPTRFAAGTPYKLYEAASFGLPIVATQLLADQLNWQDDIELLTSPANDPQCFASRIASLYRSERLWGRLRDNAVSRLERENTAEAFNGAVAKIVETSLAWVVYDETRLAVGG